MTAGTPRSGQGAPWRTASDAAARAPPRAISARMQARRSSWKRRLPAAPDSDWIGANGAQERRPVLNRLSALLIAACLAGCSAYNRGVDNVVLRDSPAVPPALIDKTDGVYKGVGQAVLVGSPFCPTERAGTVEIGDRTLFFAFTPSTIFITPVQPDGTVLTVLPQAKLEGRLTNGRLQFLVV